MFIYSSVPGFVHLQLSAWVRTFTKLSAWVRTKLQSKGTSSPVEAGTSGFP